MKLSLLKMTTEFMTVVAEKNKVCGAHETVPMYLSTVVVPKTRVSMMTPVPPSAFVGVGLGVGTVHVHARCMTAMATEARRGLQIPWGWNYGKL